MLLQYSIDTKDESFTGKSVEIRRRFAERKLETAVEGGLTENQLRDMRDLNKREIQLHGDEKLDMTITKVNQGVTLIRSDKQLNIEENMRILERDVTRASRLTKSRIDILNDLEKRISVMREEMKQPVNRTVDLEVSGDVAQKNLVKHDRLFVNCERCRRRVLKTLYKQHFEACNKLEGASLIEKAPVFDLLDKPATKITTFAPRPPRNCKFVRKGSSFFEFQWEPPVMDGGLDIFDYEIKLIALMQTFDKKSGKWKRWDDELPIRSTSLFPTSKAVCNFGAKIMNLRANTEYSKFAVRARNLQGVSEWVDLCPPTKRQKGDMTMWTEPAQAPTPPLFLRCVKVTSSCLFMTWTSSQWDGGCPIVDFVIYYTALERHVSSTSSNVIVPVDYQVNVEAIAVHPGDQEFIIRNVLPDTDVVNIRIKAVNEAGIHSDACPVENDKVRTNVMSRHFRLINELKRAKDSKDNFIDTDFFTGTVQRLARIGYIKSLLIELQTSQPDLEEEEEAITWGNIKKAKQEKLEEEERLRIEKEKADAILAQENDEDEKLEEFSDDDSGYDDPDHKVLNREKFEFSSQNRYTHYKRRISSLETRYLDLKKEKYELEVQRNNISESMKYHQKRQMELQLERDRIKNYKGEWVTSDALHGASQRYLVKDLLRQLSGLWEVSLSAVADGRLKVIKGENRKHRITALLRKTDLEIKDRRAALLMFQHEHDKAKRFGKALGVKSDEDLLKWAFESIQQHVMDIREMKESIGKLFLKSIQTLVRSAFHKWVTGEHEASNEDAAYAGNGTMLLSKCKDARMSIQSELRSAIANATALKHKFSFVGMARDQRKKLMDSEHIKEMEEGMDHVKLESSGMKYLYEADGMVQMNKFEMARSLYENQIWAIRSKEIPNIKLLAICHGRQGVMFLRMEKYNRAVVEFDRQLSLANEIDDKVEMAEAYFGIGSGYLGLNQYDDSIRYMDIAQSRMLQVGNQTKYCKALRGLEECYRRMNKADVADLYLERIQKEEDETKAKLSKLKSSLNNCSERLINSTAEIELKVEIERTSYRAIELKLLVDKLHDDLEDAEADEEDYAKLFKEHEQLIQAIDEQFDEAQNTDDTEMWSSLVHDQPQVIETEELKSRLIVRRKKEVLTHEDMAKQMQKKHALVTNLEDSIHAEDQNLLLEDGPLARAVRNDKPFRCMAFSPANAASNEVTGTASGGIENFICCEGNSMHIIDYHSGEVIHIFPGDNKSRVGKKKGHTGVITCAFYDGADRKAYTGSVDEHVICWDTENKKMIRSYEGHEGAITAIAVEGNVMATGSADVTIRLWDKAKGTCSRIVHGHSKSVLSLELGSDWMVTASADEEIRLWNIYHKSKHSIACDSLTRLIGHEVAITCVKYGKLELVSGDSLGRIFVWWLKTKEVIRRCQVHKGLIKCIQFDALYIISGGVDKCVCITDIATGEVLNTLRGHDGHILQLAFDTERIITVADDNQLLYWKLGKPQGPKDKYHVLNKGETLISLAKLYHCKVEELMRWNGISEMRQCYPGQKILVHKGDPNAPTEAEAAVIERERSRKEMEIITAKRFSRQKKIQGASIPKYDRVHRLATDIDPFSISNRMFADKKRDFELFPDIQDPNLDTTSLGARLHHRDLMSNPEGSALKPRYFIMEDNEDEWGPVADKLMGVMIDMFVEYDVYDTIAEIRGQLREKASVIGRIHTYEMSGHKEPEFPEDKWHTLSKKAQRHLEAMRMDKNINEMFHEDVNMLGMKSFREVKIVDEEKGEEVNNELSVEESNTFEALEKDDKKNRSDKEDAKKDEGIYL